MFFTQSASVETFGGSGANGDIFAAAVVIAGHLDDGQQWETTETGQQVVSRTKFYTRLAHADLFTPESRVTVNGRTATVVTARLRNADGYGGPSHLEVDLK
jgi:hypothetical protein